MNHTQFIRLALAVAAMLLILFSLSVFRYDKVAANRSNIRALHAVSTPGMLPGIDNLPQVRCRVVREYNPRLSTPQMAQVVTSGVCLSVADWATQSLYAIDEEHRYWLAVSASASGQGSKLETELWQSLDLSAEYFFVPSMQALAATDLSSAKYWCRLAYISHPQSARSAYCKGRVAQIEGRFEEAVSYFRMAAIADEDDLLDYERFQLYSRVGHVLLDHFNQAKEARVWLEQATDIPVDCCASQVALTLNRLARILESEGDYANALVYYEQALSLDDNPWYLRDIGRAYYRATKDWQLARPFLEQALAIAANQRTGDNVMLWLTVGRLYSDSGEHNALLSLLADAPEQVKTDMNFVELHARTAYFVGDRPLCLSILEKASNSEPQDDTTERLQASLCSGD
jgi:tetratricopeptide (TPR) repeat protein